jgi:hypothetical protein
MANLMRDVRGRFSKAASSLPAPLQQQSILPPAPPESRGAELVGTPEQQALVGGPMLDERGLTGLKRWAGHVHEEFLKELQGTRGVKAYREMIDNDDIVGSMLWAIKYLARQVDFRVEAGADDTEGEQWREFVEQALFHDLNLTWQDLLGEILSFLGYGWSYFEVVFKRRLGQTPGLIMGADGRPRMAAKSKFDDGLIGWRKIAFRAQDTLHEWQFDESGGIQGMIQQPPPDFKLRVLPIDKCLLFRTEAERGNPEGRSILRNAYRAWYFKKNLQTLEGIGAERDLAGYPMLKVDKEGPDIWNPNDANMVALKEQLQKLVRSIRRDEQEGAVLPWWATLELLASPSTRQFKTNEIIERYDRRIAMTVMADFILVGHEAVGSNALFGGKAGLFAAAMTGFLDNICAVFNRFAIPTLLRLNGAELEEPPKLVHGEVQDVDLTALGDFITKISQAGMPLFPNPKLEDHLYTAAKLPVPERNEAGETEAAIAAREMHEAEVASMQGAVDEPDDDDDEE